MIRVLYLQPACDLYGSSQSLLRLLRGFPRDAVDPFVVLPDRGPLETPLASIGAQVLVEKSLPVIRRASFSARGMLSLVASSAASIAGLSRLMRDLGIDLVHMNSSLVATGGLAAKLAGRPSVWHVRETHLMSKPALWRLYSRYVCATSDAIICVSTAAWKISNTSTVVQVFLGSAIVVLSS